MFLHEIEEIPQQHPAIDSAAVLAGRSRSMRLAVIIRLREIPVSRADIYQFVAA